MNTQSITNFIFEMASLRRITRSHRQMIQGVNDNIGDHSFRVAIIGMMLANFEKCDENKVLKMCLFHDLEETRIGDANYINKQYVKRKKEEASRDQLEGLPIKEEILALLEEYYKRKTIESLVTKDADNLDQMVLQQEYFFKDDVNKKVWQKHTEKFLTTESAKKIAWQICEANPFEWLYAVIENKTGEKVKR